MSYQDERYGSWLEVWFYSKCEGQSLQGKRGKGVTDLNYEGDSECVQSRLTRVEAEGQVRSRKMMIMPFIWQWQHRFGGVNELRILLGGGVERIC